MALLSLNQLPLGHNVQIDESEVHKALGEVNVTRREDGLDIVATILTHPGQGGNEGWQTGVALDSSYSMYRVYGGAHTYFARQPEESELSAYVSAGLATTFIQDGQTMYQFTDAAYTDMMNKGILVSYNDKNEVQEVCRQVIPMLAGSLDADGGTTVIYWAAGTDGSDISVMGDLTEDSSKTAEYIGLPSNWGYGTKLMPAIKYFMETFKEAPMGFYVFVTDGQLDDFEEVKQFTIQLSKDIDAKKVNPVKLVLIGVGSDIDVSQLEALDDLPDEYDLPVDVWDHKVAKEMRSVLDIFSEMVDENKIIAPSADLQDDSGNLIHSYTDGLLGLLRFKLPLTAKGFRIVLPNGNVLEQRVIS